MTRKFSTLNVMKDKNHPLWYAQKAQENILSAQQKDIEAESVDEMSPDLGNFNIGDFVSPSETSGSSNPSDATFSGSGIVGDGVTFSDGNMKIFAVTNGVLNFGVDENGEVYANNINLTLNNGSIDAAVNLNTSGNILEQTVTIGTEVRKLQVGMQPDPTGDHAEGLVTFSEPSAGGAVTVPNGDFATNDMTDWNGDVGTWTATSGYGQGYSAAVATKPHAVNTRYAVTAGNLYSFGANTWGLLTNILSSSTNSAILRIKVDVKFYTAITGGSLVSTVNVINRYASVTNAYYGGVGPPWSGLASLAWLVSGNNVTVPATATHAEFVAYVDTATVTGSASATLYLRIDDFTCEQVANQSILKFADNGLFYLAPGETAYTPLKCTVSCTSLTSDATTDNLTAYTTAAVTPIANKYVVLCVAYRDSAVEPVISGCSLTWTKWDGQNGLYMFYGIGASPTNGAITITFTGDACTSCAWSVVQFTNANGNPTGIFSDSVKASGTGTTGSATLFTFQNFNNATYAAFMHQAAEVSTPGNYFTEIHDVSAATNAVGLMTMFKPRNDINLSATWATSSAWICIGIEIAAG